MLSGCASRTDSSATADTSLRALRGEHVPVTGLKLMVTSRVVLPVSGAVGQHTLRMHTSLHIVRSDKTGARNK